MKLKVKLKRILKKKDSNSELSNIFLLIIFSFFLHLFLAQKTFQLHDVIVGGLERDKKFNN
jgi:hypothetical protein